MRSRKETYLDYKDRTRSVIDWLRKQVPESPAVTVLDIVNLARTVHDRGISCPEEILDNTSRAIQSRTITSSFYSAGSKAVKASTARHLWFTERLEEILSILSKTSASNSASDGRLKVSEDQKTSLISPSTNRQAILPVFEAGNSSQAHNSSDAPKWHDPRWDILMVLDDISHIRKYVSSRWTLYLEGKTDLISASISTQYAFEAVAKASDLLGLGMAPVWGSTYFRDGLGESNFICAKSEEEAICARQDQVDRLKETKWQPSQELDDWLLRPVDIMLECITGLKPEEDVLERLDKYYSRHIQSFRRLCDLRESAKSLRGLGVDLLTKALANPEEGDIIDSYGHHDVDLGLGAMVRIYLDVMQIPGVQDLAAKDFDSILDCAKGFDKLDRRFNPGSLPAHCVPTLNNEQRGMIVANPIWAGWFLFLHCHLSFVHRMRRVYSVLDAASHLYRATEQGQWTDMEMWIKSSGISIFDKEQTEGYCRPWAPTSTLSGLLDSCLRHGRLCQKSLSRLSLPENLDATMQRIEREVPLMLFDIVSFRNRCEMFIRKALERAKIPASVDKWVDTVRIMLQRNSKRVVSEAIEEMNTSGMLKPDELSVQWTQRCGKASMSHPVQIFSQHLKDAEDDIVCRPKDDRRVV